MMDKKSSEVIPIRKNNKRKDVVDLQQVAENSGSPPRSVDAVTPPAELTERSDTNRRRRGNKQRNAQKEADKAETVTAGVDGGNVGELSPTETNKAVKEGKRRTRKPKQKLGDEIVEVVQGDELPAQSTQEPSPQKENANDVTPITEVSIPEQEQQNTENEETAKPTKGNRRRQRQRMNKKLGKLQAQQEVQGDGEENGEDQSETPTTMATTPLPVLPSPQTEDVKSQKQPKQKKKQNKEKKTQRPSSPKSENDSHGNNGLYKHSALKNLFHKQTGADTTNDTSIMNEVVAIRPIRQPKGPSSLGERGFSAQYRNSRKVK